MSEAFEPLPEDPTSLKAVVLSQQHEIRHLKLVIAKLQRHQFGRRSEALAVDQLSLLASDKQPDAPVGESPKKTRSSTKQQSGRKALPAHLPREEHRHEVSTQQCPCCSGQLRFIG